MKHLASSRLLAHIVIGGLVFWLLTAVLRLDSLIVILNGGFGGAIAALLVAFGPLLYNTLRNKEPYSRARQMTLGWFALWVAYVLATYVSVWTRAIGEPTANPSYMSALSRFVAIYAAALQVSAPDFGLGLLYGRDRRVLWSSLVIGVLVAATIWVVQDQALLARFAIVDTIFSRVQSADTFIRQGLGNHLVGSA